MKKITSLSLAALLPISSITPIPIISLANADDIDRGEIIVTANKRAQPLSELGTSVSVITDVDIEKGQHMFVLDALETIPGVAISQNGAFGGTASVSIRGAGGDRTAVFVDGIRMNDTSSPGAAYNFGNLDPYNIQRIEILRGPQSVLYGSDAIGGVVNVITKSGGDETGVQTFAEAGAYGTYRAGVSAFGGSDTVGYNFSASGTHSDGISSADENDGNTEEDGFRGYTLSGKVTLEANENLSAEIVSRYSDNRGEFDSFGPIDGDNVSYTEEFLVLGRASHTSLGGDLVNTLSLEYAEIDRESVSSGIQTSTANGSRFNVGYLGVYDINDSWVLTAGAEHEQAEIDASVKNSIDTNSVLAELAYQGVEGLVVTGGLRYVDHETFGDATTGRVTASYVIEETGTKFIANWAEGFKSPTIYQLTYICAFCGHTEPSSDLEPEESEAYEFGVEQSFFDDRLVLGATYFHQESEGTVIFDFTDGYQNLGQSRSEGVEIKLDAVISDSLSFSAQYTHTDAIDLETKQKLIREPENRANFVVDWSPTDRLSTQLSTTYNGREYNFGSGFVSGWTRVDLRASYDITDRVQVYGRVDNLLDKEYQHVSGYGTPGRSAYVGIRATF